jgi:hypothetical protein
MIFRNMKAVTNATAIAFSAINNQSYTSSRVWGSVTNNCEFLVLIVGFIGRY